MSPGTAVRPATPADLPALRRMFSSLHEREWTERATGRALHGFDPERIRVWVAQAGDAAVGMTAMELRTLSFGGARLRAGYWTNLFVDPAHREHMFYPRLPLAMFAAARELGLDFVYGCLRRLELLDAHRRIGFVPLGGLPLRFDPLRPFRIVAKQRGWSALAALTSLPDAAWMAMRPKRSFGPDASRVNEAPWSREAARDLTALRVASADASRCEAVLDETRRFERFEETPDQQPCRWIEVLDGGTRVAGLVWCVAVRAPDIRIAVVLDAAGVPGRSRGVGAALRRLREAAHREGCDLVLVLDGGDPEVSAEMARAGLRVAKERYEMLLWPAPALEARPALGSASAWRFTFGDHDAF